MRSMLLFAMVLWSTSLGNAESTTEPYIKKSFLTLSAFECAVVAPNEKEAERLFALGLKAGREFIAFVQSSSEQDQKTIKSKVAMLWYQGGPTPDFILGQIYADRQREIYKEFVMHDQLWKLKKDNMYRAKNCSLIAEK